MRRDLVIARIEEAAFNAALHPRDRSGKYRAQVRHTLQRMSDQALEVQSGVVRGGIDREELDREVNRRRFDGGKRIKEASFNPAQHPRGRGGSFVEKALGIGRVVPSGVGTKSSFGGNLHRIKLDGPPGSASQLSFDRRPTGIWHHTFTDTYGNVQFVNPSAPLSPEQSKKLDAIDAKAAQEDIAASAKLPSQKRRHELLVSHVKGGYFTGPSALKGKK